MMNVACFGWHSRSPTKILLILFLTVAISNHATSLPSPINGSLPKCTAQMFNGDLNALWACRTLDAFQNNWFPSPIAGLFSYLDWGSFDGFWQNGAVLQILVDFMNFTNTTRYYKVIMSSWRPAEDLFQAYFPAPSCDDELWFGLSFASIYDMTGDKRFLQTVQDVFNHTWASCWDYQNSCHGGMYFGGGHYKKITITNAQALMLSAQLYRFTSNSDYLHKSCQVLNYLVSNEVINTTTFLVSDRLNLYNCLPDMRQNLTYNSGVTIGGLLELFKGTKNTTYLNMAHKIAEANIWFNSFNGVFTEYCDLTDNCSSDDNAKMFKGIFLSNLRRLMEYTNSTQLYFYQSWIQFNIDNVLKNAMCTLSPVSKCNITFVDGLPKTNLTGPIFTENWHGPFHHGGTQQQTSVLSLFIAGISLKLSCVGRDCNYDPDLPVIPKLTCNPNPCPWNKPCCPWNDQYFTCCDTDQSCIEGGCYPA